MNRIIIIGCPGSGKSTFARKLQEITQIPLYHLDMLFWEADKTMVTAEEFNKNLEKILEKDEWIIDGNYSRTMEKRLERCDTVFFFNLPTEVCVEGIINRVGTVRPDMPWVETEVDDEFLKFVQDFNENITPEILKRLEKYDGVEKIIFRSRSEADIFLNELSV